MDCWNVTREHNQLTSLGPKDLEQPLFLPYLRLCRDWYVVEWDVVRRSELVEVPVVGDDCGYLHRKRSDAIAIQQIVEAMPFPGHHQNDTRFAGGIMDGPLHRKLFSNSPEFIPQPGRTEFGVRIEAHAHEELTRCRVAELRAFGDIAPVLEQKGGDGRDQTHPIRTRQRQYEAIHADPPAAEDDGASARLEEGSAAREIQAIE